MEISDIIPRKARCGRGSGIKSGMDMEFGKLRKLEFTLNNIRGWLFQGGAMWRFWSRKW